jgi:hypothetical protein
MSQKLIIESINFTLGKKMYQIELENGHIWDISDGDFIETNINLGSKLSLFTQDCLFKLCQYEKYGEDWKNPEIEDLYDDYYNEVERK